MPRSIHPTQLLQLLSEAPTQYLQPKASRFAVTYFVKTPRGSQARFSMTSNLSHLNGAKSETAVQNYLRSKHPGTEINIISLDFV
jgi:hypothetical protein